MGARRPPGGAEPLRRRRGEWRRLRRVELPAAAPGCSAAARGGGGGARAEEGERQGPGAAPPPVARSRCQEAAVGSPRRVSVPEPGARRPPESSSPGSLSWLAEAPGLRPRCPAPSGASASLQVSQRGDRGAGHTPSPAGAAAPRSPAAEPAACGARTGRQGDLLRSGPQPESPGSLGPGAAGAALAAGPARGGVRGPGTLLRSGGCFTRSGRIERRLRTALLEHLQSRAVCLQISGIPLQYRIR